MHGHISWESLCAGAVLVCEQQAGGKQQRRGEEESSGQTCWAFLERDFCRTASAITPAWSEETGFGVGCVRAAKAGELLHELRPQIAVAAHAGVGKICVNCFRELPTTRQREDAAAGRKAQRRQSYRESTCSDACTDAQATIGAVRDVLQRQFEQQFPKAMLARMMDLCTLVLRLFLPIGSSNLVQSQESLAMALSLEQHCGGHWDQDTLLALTTAAHAVWEAIRGADPSVAPLVSVLSGPGHIVSLLQACAINAQPLGDVICLDELLARVNHSCAPNAYLHLTGHGAGMRVKLRAISDIKKGEQVTVAYFSELVQEVELRRALLNEAFHFHCRCKRCTTEDAALQQLEPKLTAVQRTRLQQAERAIQRFEKADDFESEAEAAHMFQELIDVIQMGGKYQELPPYAVFAYVRYRASVLALGAGLQAGMNDVIALSAATCADLWEVCGCAGMPKRGELLTRSAQATLQEIQAGNAPAELLRGVIGQLTEACKVLGRSRGEDEQTTEAARSLLRKAVELHQATRK